MLVDVVELRAKGQKLAAEEIAASVPVRGEFALSYVRPGWFPGKRNAPRLASLLIPGATEWALEPLDQARVTVVKGEAFVVVGIQRIYALGRRQSVDYPQAWWCRIASASGIAKPSSQAPDSAAINPRVRVPA